MPQNPDRPQRVSVFEMLNSETDQQSRQIHTGETEAVRVTVSRMRTSASGKNDAAEPREGLVRLDQEIIDALGIRTHADLDHVTSSREPKPLVFKRSIQEVVEVDDRILPYLRQGNGMSFDGIFSGRLQVPQTEDEQRGMQEHSGDVYADYREDADYLDQGEVIDPIYSQRSYSRPGSTSVKALNPAPRLTPAEEHNSQVPGIEPYDSTVNDIRVLQDKLEYSSDSSNRYAGIERNILRNRYGKIRPGFFWAAFISLSGMGLMLGVPQVMREAAKESGQNTLSPEQTIKAMIRSILPWDKEVTDVTPEKPTVSPSSVPEELVNG